MILQLSSHKRQLCHFWFGLATAVSIFVAIVYARFYFYKDYALEPVAGSVCVNGNCVFSTITEALATSTLTAGDAITVSSTYNAGGETFPWTFTTTSLTVNCLGNSSAITTSSPAQGQIFMSSSSTIQNCSFSNIKITNTSTASNVTVTGNSFSTSTSSTIVFGLAGRAVSNFTLSNNTGLTGIRILGGTGGSIASNTIYAYRQADDGAGVSFSGIGISGFNTTIVSNLLYGGYVQNDVIGLFGGGYTVSSNTIQMAYMTGLNTTVVIRAQHSYDAYSTTIMGNYINNSLQYTSGSAYCPVGIHVGGVDNSITANLTITHNTIQAVGCTAMRIINNQTDGGNLYVTSTYNLLFSASSSAAGTGIDIDNNYVPTSTISVYSNYDGFWNLATNTSTASSTLTQTNAYTANPFMRTLDAETSNDLQPAPFSHYLDVNGGEVIGAYNAERRTTIYLDDNGTIDYSAVDATSTANLNPALRSGDTVNLAAGTYGSINVTTTAFLTNNLTISGAGTSTIISADAGSNAVQLSGLSSSTVSSLVVQNAAAGYAGIKLHNTNSTTISNVTSTNNGYGIWFSGTSANNNFDNSIINSSIVYGIYSDSSANNLIRNSSFMISTSSVSIAGAGNITAYYKAKARAISLSGNPIDGATVIFNSANSSASSTLLTSGGGWTSLTGFLPAFVMTSSSVTTTNGSYNPYTVSVLATSSYAATSTSGNLELTNQTFTLAMYSGNPPAAPTGLTTSSISTSSVSLSWTDNSSGDSAEDNFIVNYITSTGTWPGSTTTLDANTTSTTISGLTSNLQYTFRVAARNTGGTSAFATSSAFYTLAQTPWSVSAGAVGTGGITLSWLGNASLFLADNITLGTNSGWTTSTSYAFTSLACQTTYQLRVRGRNGDNVNTDWSSTVSTSTLNCPTPGGGEQVTGAQSPTTTSTPVTTPTSTPTSTPPVSPTTTPATSTAATSTPLTFPSISTVSINPGITTATISWVTTNASAHELRYGLTLAYENRLLESSSISLHSFTLTELFPSTTYRLQIVASGNGITTSSLPLSFTTRHLPLAATSTPALPTPTTTSEIIPTSTSTPTTTPPTSTPRAERPLPSPTTTLPTSTLPVTPTPASELCTNGVDDDLDGQTDCADSDCVAVPACAPQQSAMSENTPASGESVSRSTGGAPAVPECGDGFDNDQDGLIDYPADSGCTGADDTLEYSPPISTVAAASRLSTRGLRFKLANLGLSFVNNTLTSIAGASVTLELEASIFPKPPRSLTLAVFSTPARYSIASTTEGVYRVTISTPAIGDHQAFLEVDYGEGEQDSLNFNWKSVPFGVAADDATGAPLSDVAVSLIRSDGTVVETAVTTVNGTYGFMVENGSYSIKFSKPGYYNRATPVFAIENNTVNSSWKLIREPLPLSAVIDPAAPLAENIKNVTKNLAEKTTASAKRTVQQVQVVADNPKVEEATKKVVAPATVGIVAVGALPFITWADVLPLLRLLFLQPVLLLGLRKRQGWGQVYNSLNKLPVELATVRLIDAKTGALLQSRVTDGHGRYAFTVEPGEYRLQVQKNNLVFPSALLSGYSSDGRRVDIYHGETITVTEREAMITVNVPLDPLGEHKAPARLYWERVGRSAQHVISWVGLVITVASYYIVPRWYIGALLLLHLALFLLFKRLALPAKVKGWGVVYDALSKQPLGQAVARLFNTQFNKLVSAELTNRRGHYHFLAGDGKYYVTYERKDYKPSQTDVIDLTGKEAEAIALDMGMVK